jgi:hypothetical protein
MNSTQLFNVATPGVILGMLLGGIAVLILVIFLIAIIETVILTLVGWEEFKKSLVVSVIMNIASGIVGGLLLVLFPQPTISGLGIAMILSILIEGWIMIRFRPNVVRLTFFAVILANTISYAIVIFPAYFYSQT